MILGGNVIMFLSCSLSFSVSLSLSFAMRTVKQALTLCSMARNKFVLAPEARKAIFWRHGLTFLGNTTKN